VLYGSFAGAHEIGTTRGSVVFRADLTCQTEIVTDAAALLERLDASTGRLPSLETGPVRPQAARAALEETFRRRLIVAFDGTEVHPSIEYSTASPPDAASPAPVTIGLVGEIPRGARDFTWTYSWTYASYALTVGSDRAGPAVTEWLEGGQASSTRRQVPVRREPADTGGVLPRNQRRIAAAMIPAEEQSVAVGRRRPPREGRQRLRVARERRGQRQIGETVVHECRHIRGQRPGNAGGEHVPELFARPQLVVHGPAETILGYVRQTDGAAGVALPVAANPVRVIEATRSTW
jgi:hypothetical protein